MKTYEVYLISGHVYRVQGVTVNVNENTGQSIIYAVNSIVAVIPSTASIRIISNNQN
jgi:hypothetical protein